MLREALSGAGLLLRGLGLLLRSPGLLALGALPALIVGAAVLAGVVALAVNATTIAEAATPFASAWDELGREALRLAVAVAVVVLGVGLAVLSFTALTLLVGDPFYERISRSVDARVGAPPQPEEVGFWRGLGCALRDALRLLLLSAGLGIVVFVVGLVPLVGAPLAAVVGALTGGWLLAVELSGYAFDARGHGLRERRAALKRMRAASVGLGTTAYLLFLVPFAAVVVMPAAVAAATLLARRALGEPLRASAAPSTPARSPQPPA